MTSLQIIVNELQDRVGAQHAITNRELRKRLADYHVDVSDSVVRAMINHIRSNGLVPDLIASAKGYYRAMDFAELEQYCNSLEGRSREILKVRQALLEHTNY